MRTIHVGEKAAEHAARIGGGIWAPGWYRARVKEVERKSTRSGGWAWKVWFTLTDIGRQVSAFINVDVRASGGDKRSQENAQTAMEIGDREQGAIADACGWPRDRPFNVEGDMPRCADRDLVVYVGIEHASRGYGPKMKPERYTGVSDEVEISTEAGEAPEWAQKEADTARQRKANDQQRATSRGGDPFAGDAGGGGGSWPPAESGAGDVGGGGGFDESDIPFIARAETVSLYRS